MDEKTPILRTEHLCKKYGKGSNEVIAVNDVCLEVEAGELHSLRWFLAEKDI